MLLDRLDGKRLVRGWKFFRIWSRVVIRYGFTTLLRVSYWKRKNKCKWRRKKCYWSVYVQKLSCALKEIINRCISLIQVIGKALVLDEIINYIQSLQRQVEVWIVVAFFWKYICFIAFFFNLLLCHSFCPWSLRP